MSGGLPLSMFKRKKRCQKFTILPKHFQTLELWASLPSKHWVTRQMLMVGVWYEYVRRADADATSAL